MLPMFLSHIAVRLLSQLSPKTREEEDLSSQLLEKQTELRSINMVDEFAKYAKTERKINKLAGNLNSYKKLRREKLVKINLFLRVGSRLLQILCLLSLVFMYRSIPLLELSADWLYPVSSLISFPFGSPGAISITCWLIVCRTVVSHTKELLT
ncbi:Tail-anchored protein insertion receptor WRB [Lamellibrachia satsuma]|nr:Tail-anchored protein insertion receptor WRB [Lamellibrachia satsuma]